MAQPGSGSRSGPGLITQNLPTPANGVRDHGVVEGAAVSGEIKMKEGALK